MQARQSEWTFQTSGSAGVSLGFVGAGAGTIYLSPPKSDRVVSYDYGSVGGGVSVGFDLPKKIEKIGLSVAPSWMPNAGQVLILPAYDGNELTESSFTGFCVMTEVSVPVGSMVGMFMGVSPGDLYKELGVDTMEYLSVGGHVISWLLDEMGRDWPDFLKSSANALLLIEGMGANLAKVGVLNSWGYVGHGEEPPKPKVPIISAPPGPEDLEMKWSSTGKETAVTIPADALFDFDKDKIKTKAEAAAKGGVANEPALKEAGEAIKARPNSAVLIKGHTDSIGPMEYNIGLSARRAANVARWMISNNYASNGQLKVLGLGKSQPVATNKTWKGRQKNRRVEISIFT